MKKTIQNISLDIDDIGFYIEFFNDFEIRFRRISPPRDKFGSKASDCERIPTQTNVAISLFRHIERAVVDYLRTKKPPFIYFTGDKSRFNLYTRLARKLKKEGYTLSFDKDRPYSYYCYRDWKAQN